MDNLINTTALVKSILEADERARNSDSWLYLCVIDLVGASKGIKATQFSVVEFLIDSKRLGFPAFETVRRTRQKVQATYPELAANAVTRAERAKFEEEFRAYALEVFR